ncbi:efflux RND transporter periplasmic adaptor subunit [Neptunicella sp. SCSIO 80796]|uniref:efflux RND transporter periplasmic adaptor subunit n=1 Tax=Neptunicella plasticusilytica TaxID=3117012 RepID=UPI003A4D754F
MDKIKQSPSGLAMPKNRLMLVVLATIAGVVLLAGLVKSAVHQVEISRADILIGEVKQGELQLKVDGFGELYSEQRQLLTAVNAGIVTEILQKPGDRVTADTVILRLSNPELEQRLKTEQQNLASEQANLRKLRVEQKREMLTENSNLIELQSELEIASLKRKSKQQLQQQGIISKLEFIETELQEKQLANSISLAQSRITQLKEIHAESLNIQDLKVAQQQDNYDNVKKMVEDMNVKAGQAGILQTLPVELGESVSTGMEVASVGRIDNLIARIQISQVQATHIQPGNPVSIKIWPDSFKGHVLRIDPMVKEKMISVDVAIDQTLPASVKPNQDVSAEIITKTIDNTLYVKRPANLSDNSNIYLYRLSDDYKQATRIQLTLGEMSSNQVEILQGAEAGERLIISDLTYLNNDSISII